jgi:hypothetical protein
MADLVVIIRILLGWFGVYLASNGLPPELVHLLTKDPQTVDAIANLAAQIVGAMLAVGQIVWWRLAKRFGWRT